MRCGDCRHWGAILRHWGAIPDVDDEAVCDLQQRADAGGCQKSRARIPKKKWKGLAATPDGWANEIVMTGADFGCVLFEAK